MLRLMEKHPLDEVAEAVRAALEAGTPRLASVRLLLQRDKAGNGCVPPVSLERDALAAVTVEEPDLDAYDDALGER